MKTYETHEFTRAALALAPDPNLVDPMDVMRQIAEQRAADPPAKPDSVTDRVTVTNAPNKTFKPTDPPAAEPPEEEPAGT